MTPEWLVVFGYLMGIATGALGYSLIRERKRPMPVELDQHFHQIDWKDLAKIAARLSERSLPLATATFVLTDPNGVSFSVVGIEDAVSRFDDLLRRSELQGRFSMSLNGRVVVESIVGPRVESR